MNDGAVPVGRRVDHSLNGTWRKSSYSQSNGHCVEVTQLPDGRVGVRDSKVANGPVLPFEPRAWTAFLREIQTTERASFGI
jgi:hypothetical protein